MKKLTWKAHNDFNREIMNGVATLKGYQSDAEKHKLAKARLQMLGKVNDKNKDDPKVVALLKTCAKSYFGEGDKNSSSVTGDLGDGLYKAMLKPDALQKLMPQVAGDLKKLKAAADKVIAADKEYRKIKALIRRELKRIGVEDMV